MEMKQAEIITPNGSEVIRNFIYEHLLHPEEITFYSITCPSHYKIYKLSPEYEKRRFTLVETVNNYIKNHPGELPQDLIANYFDFTVFKVTHENITWMNKKLAKEIEHK